MKGGYKIKNCAHTLLGIGRKIDLILAKKYPVGHYRGTLIRTSQKKRFFSFSFSSVLLLLLLLYTKTKLDFFSFFSSPHLTGSSISLTPSLYLRSFSALPSFLLPLHFFSPNFSFSNRIPLTLPSLSLSSSVQEKKINPSFFVVDLEERE